MPERRVVVTGIGMITPLGLGVEPTWAALLAGRSGVTRITRFDPGPIDAKIAAEVKGFEPTNYVDKKEARRLDPFLLYALAAGQEALKDAGLPTTGVPEPEATGCIVGSGIGGITLWEEQHAKGLAKGFDRLSPFFIPMMISNMAAGQLSIHFGAKGPSYAVVSACATSAHCIGESARKIQHGDADVMIAGGTEATITPLAVGGFSSMKALSTRNDDPAGASRPFDKGHDGFVCGEGAGIVVLEELEHAKQRGAKIYGELTGYAATSDAYHISAPAPGGEGGARCMRLALKDARLPPEAIGYINAHGTSTPIGDPEETRGIKTAFGAHAYKLAVSSTKSMTGHTLGAAGAIEAIFSVLAIARGVLPPTINQVERADDCDLDYVPNVPREVRVDAAMSNSFGFGGTNAVLIFQRFEG